MEQFLHSSKKKWLILNFIASPASKCCLVSACEWPEHYFLSQWQKGRRMVNWNLVCDCLNVFPSAYPVLKMGVYVRWKESADTSASHFSLSIQMCWQVNLWKLNYKQYTREGKVFTGWKRQCRVQLSAWELIWCQAESIAACWKLLLFERGMEWNRWKSSTKDILSAPELSQVATPHCVTAVEETHPELEVPASRTDHRACLRWVDVTDHKNRHAGDTSTISFQNSQRSHTQFYPVN